MKSQFISHEEKNFCYTSILKSSFSTQERTSNNSTNIETNKKLDFCINSFRNLYHKYIDPKQRFDTQNLITFINTLESSDTEEDEENYKMKLHKKISKLPYKFIDDETAKKIFIRSKIKPEKFPKFYSQKNIQDEKENLNMNLEIKKDKKNRRKKYGFLSSQQKFFREIINFEGKEDGYTNFDLFYDKDIIEKSKEFNEELIENKYDIDNSSDEDDIKKGHETCLNDLKLGFKILSQNPNLVSFFKKNQVNFFSN